jgi:hypothetical protein
MMMGSLVILESGEKQLMRKGQSYYENRGNGPRTDLQVAKDGF